MSVLNICQREHGNFGPVLLSVIVRVGGGCVWGGGGLGVVKNKPDMLNNFFTLL